MPATRIYLLALSCLCGGTGTCLAQRAPVAPLTPTTPIVAPPRTPSLGVEVKTGGQFKHAAAPAPTAAAPGQAQLARVYRPVLLVNSHLIVGDNVLRNTDPKDIRDLHIYKGADAPLKWRSLTANGIIDMTLKTKSKYKSETLASLRRGLKLSGKVSFLLDGVPLQDTSLRIAAEAIEGLDISRSTAGGANSATVNIRVVRLPPPLHPPGTIMIRGLAQQ